MLKNTGYRTLILTWLVWASLLIGFQTLVDARYQPNRPDYALDWTPNETAKNSQKGKVYLLEPFMNRQVSWDSEFYLSIATVGYDDPLATAGNTRQGKMSLNYAFFPLYPLAMRAVGIPLGVLGMNPIATNTLAGVLVALVGTLGAVLALYELTRDELGETGAQRAVFYLLIFPSAFFFAQVFSEGLFAGLAFGCLALLHRKRLAWAALLAALATWTRGNGIVLVVPLALAWAGEVPWRTLTQERTRHILPLQGVGWILVRGLLVLTPLAAYLIWRQWLGAPFDVIERDYFGRKLFDISSTLAGLNRAIQAIRTGAILPMRIYYLLEFAGVGLALIASFFILRQYPGVALFSLVALVIPLTSGAPQSLIRYILTLPTVFIFLGRLGRNVVFDRAWTVGSLLAMGMLTSLFTWDMWVA